MLYTVLALVDTALTWHGVRSGLVREANPLLRPLLASSSAATFVIAKNVLAISMFVAVGRFHLFRHGLGLLRAIVFAYLALDLYWLALLVWRHV
jgi:hypothetical protein